MGRGNPSKRDKEIRELEKIREGRELVTVMPDAWTNTAPGTQAVDNAARSDIATSRRKVTEVATHNSI